MHDVTVRRHFHATHGLRHYPKDEERPHRHRWEVRVTVSTPELGPAGFGIDFEVLDARLGEILAGLEGRHLNEVEPFNKESPSAERLAQWIHGRMADRLDDSPVRLLRVEVFQGPRFSAAYWEE